MLKRKNEIAAPASFRAPALRRQPILLRPVSIRYPRDYRSDPQVIASEVLIPIADGGTVPLAQVAKVTLAQGPASIRTENAQLAVYIFVDHGQLGRLSGQAALTSSNSALL
jgi:Cu/Ag efflux pump CusA